MTRRHLLTVAATLSAALIALTACSSGASDPPADSSDSTAQVTLRYLSHNNAAQIAFDDALIAAFNVDHPNIEIKVEYGPDSVQAENYVKTQLATGEMADVFTYNSGALLMALNPEDTLVDLSGEPWMADVTDRFQAVVKAGDSIVGAPNGASGAGGILYNKKVYADLGLTVPTDWAQFKANNEKVKAAGLIPVLQSYGDGYTAQFAILSDYGNVATEDPGWADKYTANQAKFADEPALAGFRHLASFVQDGFLNEDYPAMTLDQALTQLMEGKAAHYPSYSGMLMSMLQIDEALVDDVGLFPQPADDAAHTSLTIWEPSAWYIPKTTTGAKLDAAKAFLAFALSEEGCAVYNTEYLSTGAYEVSTCEIPTDSAALTQDVVKYSEGNSAPALEFVSPVKGPNLISIAVAVGSGITSAEEGARQYDLDVEKQAQQLGLEGW
ncbi:MAG: ABC transporter substrate-binding protein [Propionibacteriaceae bacterium]|jgi:raffinose/stachyose/melibiose transport system substrate-binding protein|nr:ABC transporter substrate-binding protein [Propionibacteriaceae bacterium]